MSLHSSHAQLPNENTKNHGYLGEQQDLEGSTSIVFSVSEKVGALAESLKIFQVSGPRKVWPEHNERPIEIPPKAT